jgi:hypothetical protein
MVYSSEGRPPKSAYDVYESLSAEIHAKISAWNKVVETDVAALNRLLGNCMKNSPTQENDIPDWADTRSTLDQLNDILGGLDEELWAGALGIRSTIGYMQNGVTSFKLFQVQKVAVNYGRVYASHVRLLGMPPRRQRVP